MAFEAGESASSQSTHLPAVMPRRSDLVEVADFGSSFVVFDPRNHLVHELSGWLAIVFDACDGECSPEDLASEAVDFWQGDSAEAHDRVGEAIRAFESLGILDGTEPMTPPPCLGCGDGAVAKRRRWFARP